MATPISLIDQPSFWAAFLLAEIALPMIIRNKRWAGMAMLLLAGAFYAGDADFAVGIA
jgi:hypothetical protein